MTDVIPKQGNIKRHHFAHKNSNDCQHYENPSESEIHKDAKMLLKSLFENGIRVTFTRKCNYCENNEEFIMPEFKETMKVIIEYRFQYKESLKVADVVFIENEEMKKQKSLELLLKAKLQVYYNGLLNNKFKK